jgi:hypothetical protein
MDLKLIIICLKKKMKNEKSKSKSNYSNHQLMRTKNEKKWPQKISMFEE